MRCIESVAVIGLGRLGIPLAAVLAGRDFYVTGVDIDPGVVRSVDVWQPLIYEIGKEAI